MPCSRMRNATSSLAAKYPEYVHAPTFYANQNRLLAPKQAASFLLVLAYVTATQQAKVSADDCIR